MFALIRSISNISKKLLFFGTFLLLAFSGHGQDVSIEDVTEDEDVGNMVFTVTFNGFRLFGTVVTYSFVDDTATGGIDFDNTIGTPLFFSGFNGETQTITVPIIDDFIDEGNREDFTVQLGPPTNGVGLAGGGDARGRIRDNDTAGINISTTTGTTTEAGGQATFTFTLTSQPTADVTIFIDRYDATETNGPESIILTSTDWNTGVDLI
ncbi:MAG: Calx-beta domain-containing protein, partial [Maribacter sp.]